LGLQSTFNFVIPFISATDFRYNVVSVNSALNSDGWFTVWLMNPLTYPPSTPPTQQIAVMLSAGSDFSLRLPISPVYNQGLSAEDGPHDSVECGVTNNQDASLTGGHSVGLPTPHTRCSFFFDRYRFVGIVKSTDRNSPKPKSPLSSGKIMNLGQFYVSIQYRDQPEDMIGLTPVPNLNGVPISGFAMAIAPKSGKQALLVKGDPLLYRCCPSTYAKFDLEFTVVPPLNWNDDYIVHWYPPGAPVDNAEMMVGMTGTDGTAVLKDDGENLSAAVMSYNPTFYAKAPAKVSAVIPFCLPTSLLPLY
ncbi:polyprotein, partial [cosavirus A22]